MTFAVRTLAVVSLVLTLITVGLSEYWMLQEIRGMPFEPFIEWLIIRPSLAFGCALFGIVGAGLLRHPSGIGPSIMLAAGVGLLVVGGLSAIPSAAPLVLASVIGFFTE